MPHATLLSSPHARRGTLPDVERFQGRRQRAAGNRVLSGDCRCGRSGTGEVGGALCQLWQVYARGAPGDKQKEIQEFVKAGALRLLSGVIVSSEDLEILRQCLLGLQTLLRHDADGTWGKEFRQLGGLDKVQRILEMPKIPRPEPETDFLFNWGPVLIEEDCIEFANDILTMFQTT
uniref:Uncharacterized protein n=1 Tax=Chromera velia CCMP2878 TaxID=1169474 RepID=A0A0G4GL77_9ALVE|eukprot:Cvel_22414.t1-p1 / transcript=Cvel_22414.t1 / gene=Cvel_22414 / organism=Chromera_velia_CCMP2878 / gene_product=hypothetical protein / transcript_product=hypothetical protein / location=Cvel_scaffold2199:26644-30984(-) / protein_length=175 / sequence_SO=supercontig / SO=protein_coding / is_pseudo=false